MATATLTNRPAADALRDSALPFLRHLKVGETAYEVTISGRVSSYYYKQLAQEAIMPFLGDRRLKNLVVVE